MKKMKTTREILRACKIQKTVALKKAEDLWKSQEDDRQLVAEIMEKVFGKVRRPLYLSLCVFLMVVKFSVYAAIELVKYSIPFVRRGVVFIAKFLVLYFCWVFNIKSDKDNAHKPQHAVRS